MCHRSEGRAPTRHQSHTEKGGEYGPPAKGNERNDDHYTAAKDASSADASDSASNNESCGARGGAAESGADLEDEDGDEEHPFGGIELVDATKKRIENGSSQHVGAAIPADILDRVELVGDAGDGGSDDHPILLGP